ncbi:hypothetical protein GPALN_013202 [Globodera pallida]|nr:hypothetical protein GPALN_013202 [Globodera pallida]
MDNEQAAYPAKPNPESLKADNQEVCEMEDNQPPPAKKSCATPHSLLNFKMDNKYAAYLAWKKDNLDSLSMDNQEVEEMNDIQSPAMIPVKKASVQLWKLFRPKYMLTYRMCDLCLSALWNNKNKFSSLGDRTVVTFELCSKCTETNCSATDLLAPQKQKK